ncbi:MAG: citrate:proton symporter, partial [Tissierellales bacterium]
MVTFFSYAMIITFMVLIMKKKLTPFTALVLVPFIFSIIGALIGIFPTNIGEMALQGIKDTATTGVMLLFAILYFSIMLDAGLFDPLTNFVIRVAKGDPLKILVGTAIVAAMVSLNGDGTTTTLITCTAFLPIYRRLNLNIMYFGVLVILMNAIMNLLPWGGPTARVIAVLDVNEQAILRALAPGMIVSVIYMIFVAYYMGKKERKRLGIQQLTSEEIEELCASSDKDEDNLKRPQYIWINAIMTIVLVVMLVLGTLPSVVLFLVGTVLALIINYHSLSEQRERIQENAGDAVQVVILVLGAGILMGLFTGTGMADALASSLTKVIPERFGRFWGLIVALLSAPGTFFLSNDAFYFGVLPVLAEAG